MEKNLYGFRPLLFHKTQQGDNDLKLSGKFIDQVIRRDFNPIKGQQTRWEYHFQCKLHLYGSTVILFLLFLSGFCFLATFNGMSEHLISLEENPFASAILIKGGLQRSRLNALKDQLFFNPKKNVFSEKECDDCIVPAIKGVYPFNIVSLRFLDSDFSIFDESYDVLTVKVPDQKSETNEADYYIKKWLTDNFQKGHQFFHSEKDAVNQSILLSPSLFKKFGFKPDSINSENNPSIFFLSPTKGRKTIFQDREKAGNDQWTPLNSNEIITYTNKASLFNVSKRFLGGDAIITEGFYYHLFKQSSFDPRKSVEFFYINYSDGKLNSNDERIIETWAYDTFGKNFINKPYFSSNRREVKIKFNPYMTIKDINTKCYIKRKLKILNNKISAISIDFKEDKARYDGQEMMHDGQELMYYYSYLYINKDPKILQNISKFIHYLKKKFNCIFDDNQVMTLIKYQKDMDRMTQIFRVFFLGFIILLPTYILVTFSLLLQVKRHQIGIFKSMGASTLKLICIYIYEAMLLIRLPLILSFGVSFGISFFIPEEELYYSINFLFIGLYVLAIVVLTIIGAGLSAKQIVSRQPYQLISYQT